MTITYDQNSSGSSVLEMPEKPIEVNAVNLADLVKTARSKLREKAFNDAIDVEAKKLGYSRTEFMGLFHLDGIDVHLGNGHSLSPSLATTLYGLIQPTAKKLLSEYINDNTDKYFF